MKSKKANKTNLSVRFLEESMARQSAFEINWPLKRFVQSFHVIQSEKTTSVLFFSNDIELFAKEIRYRAIHVIQLEKTSSVLFFPNGIEVFAKEIWYRPFM